MEKRSSTKDPSEDQTPSETRKKLSLNRETIRSLNDDELVGVAGASLFGCTGCTGCSACTKCGKHQI